MNIKDSVQSSIPKPLSQKDAIRAKNISKSIARSEKDNVCDYEIMTAHEIRCLLNATADLSCYSSVLLRLSLHTGRSIKSLLQKNCVYVKPSANSLHSDFGFIEVSKDFPCTHINGLKAEVKKENKGYVCSIRTSG
jgi:hypothetical protein